MSLDISTLTDSQKAALVALVASKVAPGLGLGANEMQVLEQQYQLKLARARAFDLNSRLAANNDPVLAQLVAAFKSDDTGLASAYEVYMRRSPVVRNSSEATVKNVLGMETWEELTGAAKEASYALSVAKLAPACGLDANFSALKMQEYNALIAECRRARLNAALASNTDPVLAQLVGNFKSDDPGLLNAFTVYTQRATAVKSDSEATVKEELGLAANTTLAGRAKDAATALSVAKLAQACGLDANAVQLAQQEHDKLIVDYRKTKLNEDIDGTPAGTRMTACINEVKATLDIAAGTTPDALAMAAAKALCWGRYGEACGYDANFAQLKMQEYTAKIAEWRKLKLNTALASNTDAVLAELVSNFRNDDAGLLNAFTVYTARATAVKTNSEATVKDELGIAAGTTLTGAAAEAATALSVAKLAQACGLDANAVQLKMQQYQAALQTYRKNALNTALASNTDPVLAQLVGNFKSDDPGLLNAFTVYTQRATNVKSDSDATIRELLGITGSAALTGAKKDASTALSVAKLAEACGMDANFVQLKIQESNALVTEVRRNAAETDIAAGENSTGEMKKCCDEVRATLEIANGTALDKIALAAAAALCQTRTAARNGYDANYIQLKEQEYAARIQEWRKIALNKSLKTENDPVLVQLLANFKADDPGLVNAFAVYTNRATQIKAEAAREINVAHGWNAPLDTTSQTLTAHNAYPAHIALVVAKLAQACGLDANASALLEQQYQARLREARVKDLSEGLDAVCNNFALPFLFATTGESDAAGSQISQMWKFSLGRSLFANVGYKVSAITAKCHPTTNNCGSNPVSLAAIAAVDGENSTTRTLLAVSTNTVRWAVGQLVTWQFNDFTIPEGARLELQPLLGAQTFDALAQAYAENGWEYGKAYQFAVRLSPAIEATDADDYWYSDSAHPKVAQVCPYVRVYSYEQGATSLYTIAQRVMRRVFPFVTNGGDAPLPFSITAFANSVNEASVAAENEVKATCETSGLDPLLEDAAECLATAHVAPALGLDANFAQLRLQEYTAKIAEWRKVKLNQSLASNTDPVLAQLVANFKSGDDGLLNAYTIYTQRVEAVKADAYGEIERIHDWQWIDSTWNAQTPLTTKIAAMDGLTKAAHIALCAKYLAAACGMAPEMVNVYEQHYRARLKAARTADLESTSVTDPVDAEVLALIRGAFASEAALPRSMKSLTDKIDRLKEIARKEVLASHDWSFAEAEVLCEGARQDGDKAFPFVAALPKGCLVVSAVYGTDSKVSQWKVCGREIRAAQQITRIVYVKDVADYAAWHPKAYRAFILRLAADTAKSVAEKPSERQLQEQLYRDALEDAKACDAKSVNTPDEAYGDNELADSMLYGGGRSRHFDGLFAD
jgi:hypothetical protein